MTTTTGKNGRLGNQIIRNLAVSLLAEKHNLNVNYYNKDLIHKLGIQLFCGSCSYNKIQRLTDENYFLIYNMDTIHYNLDPNIHYFQTKDITVFLHNYLHKIQSSIIAKNPFKERYNNNNDLCIHIRLTDVAHFNPGISYYRKAIQPIKFDNLYICTDEPNNPMIVELLKLYPSKLIKYDEITTLQFASTCKHIILSHGSFSAIIGYLSFFSKVYYPKYDLNKIWYGDMFSIDHWIKIE